MSRAHQQHGPAKSAQHEVQGITRQRQAAVKISDQKGGRSRWELGMCRDLRKKGEPCLNVDQLPNAEGQLQKVRQWLDDKTDILQAFQSCSSMTSCDKGHYNGATFIFPNKLPLAQ